MTDLPGPMEVLQQTRLQLRMGRSLAGALGRVVDHRSDAYSKSLKVWLVRMEAGQRNEDVVKTLPELGRYGGRKLMLDVFERGLKGASIDDALDDLEKEFFFSIENAYERHLQVLPLKLLMPLTLFILPAVMMLIAGPLIFSLKAGF